MPTRFYLPSTGTAGQTPTVLGGWTSSDPDFVRRVISTSKLSSAMADLIINDTTTTPEYIAIYQGISAPIVGNQTITGTIKGQIRCFENSTNYNGTLAIGVQVVSGDGTVQRGIALAVAASDSAASPYELLIAPLTNTAFYDVSESASITLSDVSALNGDRIVLEIGTRNVSATTTRTAPLNFGDDSGTDLPEDHTETNAYN